MTAKTLEEEAREAAEEYVIEEKRKVHVGGKEIDWVNVGADFNHGYIAAATLRDKEIEEKNAKIGQMVEERASDLSLFKDIGDDYEAETKELRTEIEELRQKLADAESKTAKWVLDDDAEEEKRLELLGFLHTAQYETVGGYGYWLMVPPVHIPEREAKLEQ